MDILYPNLLLVTMNCVLLNCSKRVANDIYSPYGPKMCKERFKDSNDSFIYAEEDLSCRLSVSDPETEVTFSYFGKDKMMHGTTSPAMGLMNDSCDLDDKGGMLSNQYKVLTNTSKDMARTEFLHEACKEGKLCMVQYILSNGLADINCRGKAKRTPVMVATENGQEAVFDLLVREGCDLSALDKNNNTVLHLACKVGNTFMVKKLVDSGRCDIERRFSSKVTPVMYAVIHNHTMVFQLLVSRGCNLTKVDSLGSNILHAASYKGNLIIVKYILSMNLLDKESRGFGGRTPLLYAAAGGRIKVFMLLVNNGCNTQATDVYKYNVLHAACDNNHIGMANYILSNNISMIESRGKFGKTAVMFAASHGYVGVVKFLKSKNCNMKAVDAKGNNVLHVACHFGQLDVVKYILSQDIISIESRGKQGCTPVLLAAEYGHLRIVKFLVRHGCYLKAVSDNSKYTVLHLACESGRINVVKYVLTLNILNVMQVNQYGETPLQLAEKFGHGQIAALLRKQL